MIFMTDEERYRREKFEADLTIVILNAVIDDLSQKNDALTARHDRLKAKFYSLKPAVTELINEINRQKAANEELKSRILSMAAENERLRGGYDFLAAENEVLKTESDGSILKKAALKGQLAGLKTRIDIAAKSYDLGSNEPLGFSSGEETEEGGHIEVTIRAVFEGGSVNEKYDGMVYIKIDGTAGAVVLEPEKLIRKESSTLFVSEPGAFEKGIVKFYLRCSRACEAKLTVSCVKDKRLSSCLNLKWYAEIIPEALVFEGENPAGFRKYSCKNDKTVKMIKVPAASFDRGDGEFGGSTAEIRMRSFYMAETPTTNGQLNKWLKLINLPLREEENMPAVNVAWVDAKNYACWLMTGQTFSDDDSYLPTEAQFEKAMRGAKLHGLGNDASGKKFPWGRQFDKSRCNASSAITEVRAFPPQGYYGLYDLAGNVWEWCRDYYSLKHTDEPINPLNDSRSAKKAIKGGSWYLTVKFLRAEHIFRCSFRTGYPPLSPYGSFGFRPVIDT